MATTFTSRYLAIVHPHVQRARTAGRRSVSEADTLVVHGELVAAGCQVTPRGLYTSMANMVKGSHLGYESWVSGGAESAPVPAPATAAPQSWPTAAEVQVTDEDVVPLGGDRQPPTVTIAVSDMQFGEKEVLLDLWHDCCADAIARARAVSPARIRILLNGDEVTGDGAFRDQVRAVLLPTTDPQVIYATERIYRDLVAPAIAIAPVDVTTVLGNHDRDGGANNKAVELIKCLRAKGVVARYGGKRCLVNLAPEGSPPYVLLMDHGKGNSSFQATSMAHIRDLKDYLIQVGVMERMNDGLEPMIGTVIRRILSAHTHWLQIALSVGGVYLDNLGGWTRPERHGLGGAARPVGGVLYIHDGATLKVSAVRPSDAAFGRSLNDPRLHYRNLADIAQVMDEVVLAAIADGVLVPEGTVV